MKILPSYPSNFSNVPIVVSIVNGLQENGMPNVVSTHSVKCYFQEKRKVVFDAEGKKVQLAGLAIIGGDIASSNHLEGFVTVFSEEFKIFKGSRLRDLNGEVHHIELELV